MLGLFGSLDMAGRALSVQQDAMSVAGNNLANVNNSAYSRQILNTTSATPLTTQIGDEGTGVQEVSISQVRDAILDNQIQAEGSVTSSLTAQQSVLQDAQAQLAEQVTSGASAANTSADGLAASLNDFFTAMNSLSANASDPSLRQAAIQSAQNLATRFNQVSSGLNTVVSGINTSIIKNVATANQDLTDIASLNQQIMVANAQGGNANDLVDQRQAKIEDLAGYMNITTTSQTDGSINVAVAGVGMVAGGATRDSLTTTTSGSGQVYVSDSNDPGYVLGVTGGTIGGNITVRDGAVANIQSSVDTLASQLVTQVNTIYSAGYDLNGNTGQNLFTGNNAGTIAVNSNLTSNLSAFQAAGVSGAASDNTVVSAIATLGSQSISSLGNSTFSANYANNVSNLGGALSSVNDQVSNNSVVSQMLTQQRDSVSGVSTDEEMTNLVQFQKAYEASAEVITTLNEMLETLISMKTE